MKKYIIFTLFLFTLFFINVFSVSADFSSCPSKTHSWPAETPGSTWSWTVTDRSEMIRGLESISGINSGTTYNASTGVFAGGDPTVFGLSANATTAEIGVLARQWSGIGNKNIDSVLNGFYSTNPQLKKIAMAEILNAVAVVGSAGSAGRQYLAELDGSKMTEIYNAYLAAYPTTSKDWINQLWNQMAPICGKIVITSPVNTGNNTPAPSESSTKFKIGDILKTTTNINIRATANGNILGQKIANSYGTVTEGPVVNGGYSWWKVDFQSGVDGWSAENYLIIATLPNTNDSPGDSTTPVTDQAISAFGFNIGDTVVVRDGIVLNVRATASTSSASLGKQNGGSIGELVEGPKKVNGYIWWKINYHIGADGWSVENYFTKASSDTIVSTSNGNSSAVVSNPSSSQTSSVVGILKMIDKSSARSKGCYKYPDGSVIAQNMTDSEGNYCVYLAKTTADQQAINATRMGEVLAQYPKWNECAANTAELKIVNSKLGYFGDLTWQPPTEGEANYDLYLKCKDMIGVLQYINQNRFEIHPAVWLYEKGFWIGRSTNGVPYWPPVKCDSCLSTSRTFNVSAVVSTPAVVSNSPAPFFSSPLSVPASTGRPTTTTPSYLGSTPFEFHPALTAEQIAKAMTQYPDDPYDGLKYKETSSQALSANEKTATYAYIDDSSDGSTNSLQYFSPCGSLLTQYARTGSVTLGRGPVYRSALSTCSAINGTSVPDDSSVRSYACENFLYKSRVVGRATFAFTCKAVN